MSRIYDINGETLTEGLQGSKVCDQAIHLRRGGFRSRAPRAGGLAFHRRTTVGT